MKCTNDVTYFVPRGYGYREVQIPCGSTDPHGNRAQCESCKQDPVKREENRRILENADADNAWLRSAGWGEM